jgi:hypothetical protein
MRVPDGFSGGPGLADYFIAMGRTDLYNRPASPLAAFPPLSRFVFFEEDSDDASLGTSAMASTSLGRVRRDRARSLGLYLPKIGGADARPESGRQK